ncbi:unnamed protein product [Cylicocyclus nassatus]|uniref:Uncharacterized protein n=1 Tax=Cylicocyclus nassatus TaxID=53992 RepID=A0AA36DKV5_CYLNA|nr:unnamed protein product [Cylicocyclus nassatus]
MMCIVLLFFLSLLSLDMALRGEPRRNERLTRELHPELSREERRTRELRPEFPRKGTRDGRPGKSRTEERRTGVLGTPGFGFKDRGSSRDNKNIPHGMDRMTIGRTSGHHAMERGRENFGDRQLIKGKYSSRTKYQAPEVGGHVKVGDKWVDKDLWKKNHQLVLSQLKVTLGLDRMTTKSTDKITKKPWGRRRSH